MINYIVFSLTELLSHYPEDKLNKAFKEFSCCREADLENFLLNKAILYENNDFGKTHLLIDEEELANGNFKILAYFTIATGAIDISALSTKKRRRLLGNYPGRDKMKNFPAFLIGQLGRNDNCDNSDISGELLLKECFHSISSASKLIGGRLVILECREPLYDKFYSKHGFMKLYDELSEDGLYTLFLKIDFREYWRS